MGEHGDPPTHTHTTRLSRAPMTLGRWLAGSIAALACREGLTPPAAQHLQLHPGPRGRGVDLSFLLT